MNASTRGVLFCHIDPGESFFFVRPAGGLEIYMLGRLERTKNQPEVFLHNSETPSGHGRPCLQVKDVRKKTLFFLRSERWGESFLGRDVRPGYPPRLPRDIPPKNFMFRLLFRS